MSRVNGSYHEGILLDLVSEDLIGQSGKRGGVTNVVVATVVACSSVRN